MGGPTDSLVRVRHWWTTARRVERVRAVLAATSVAGLLGVAVVALASPERPAPVAIDPGAPLHADVPPARAVQPGAKAESSPARKKGRKPQRRGKQDTGRAVKDDRKPSTGRRTSRGRGQAERRPGSSSSPATSATAATPVADGRTPVVVGASVQDPDAVGKFFRQYSVDAGAGDPVGQLRAVAAWINAHGGILGRPLELRFRQYSAYGRPTSKDDEATCAEWSAGSRPVAAVDTHSSVDVLMPCLRKAGIPSVVSSSATPASGTFADNPRFAYAPGGVALDRAQAGYVAALKDAGFFAPGERVGLLTATGLPQLATAKDALGAALRTAGVDPVAEANVSLEDPASFFASEADAVLRFRLRRVTRVVALDENGLAVGQFMRGAESQEFRPLYGLSSVSTPAFLTAGAPLRQLRGAVGVGWAPHLDVAAQDAPTNTTEELCSSIFRAAGVTAGGRTPFGQFAAFGACDSLLAIRDAFARSGEVSTDGLRRGMELLGGRASGVSLRSWLDGSRHDGAATWRLLRFNESCSCFRYGTGAGSF